MRMTKIGRVSGSSRWRMLRAGVVALAAAGVLGAVLPPAAAAAARAPHWTWRHPRPHPAARGGAMMAYDAATRTVVLFGGEGWSALGGAHNLGDTWIWDGTTWTKRHPAGRRPVARAGAMMAYDAATRTVVMFGGVANPDFLNQTWTWDGTTWTEQAPAASPPAIYGAMMAYDAATRTVVLFGGLSDRNQALDDTWTWDGTTWTEQHPARHPPARAFASMAYDAATRTVVLFGGSNSRALAIGDTWTWNGTTWTKRHPAGRRPVASAGAMMAYDAATRTVVLFGGYGKSVLGGDRHLGDTWTWNGAAWTKQNYASRPAARSDATMAYDAATRTVLLFGGGAGPSQYPRDTWTWG